MLAAVAVLTCSSLCAVPPIDPDDRRLDRDPQIVETRDWFNAQIEAVESESLGILREDQKTAAVERLAKARDARIDTLRDTIAHRNLVNYKRLITPRRVPPGTPPHVARQILGLSEPRKVERPQWPRKGGYSHPYTVQELADPETGERMIVSTVPLSLRGERDVEPPTVTLSVWTRIDPNQPPTVAVLSIEATGPAEAVGSIFDLDLRCLVEKAEHHIPELRTSSPSNAPALAFEPADDGAVRFTWRAPMPADDLLVMLRSHPPTHFEFGRWTWTLDAPQRQAIMDGLARSYQPPKRQRR